MLFSLNDKEEKRGFILVILWFRGSECSVAGQEIGNWIDWDLDLTFSLGALSISYSYNNIYAVFFFLFRFGQLNIPLHLFVGK